MSAIDASVIFSSKEAFRKFAKQFDSSSGQLSMSKSELKWAILYMYGKRPKDEEIDQLVHSIWGNNSDDITFTEAEFEKIISTLNDPFSSSIDFEPNSLYDNYKLMFELLEDYENKNQNRKGFISLTDFKSAVRKILLWY